MPKVVPFYPVHFSNPLLNRVDCFRPKRVTPFPEDATPYKKRLYTVVNEEGVPYGFELRNNVLYEVSDTPATHFITVDGYAVPVNLPAAQTAAHLTMDMRLIKECSLEVFEFGNRCTDVWQRLVVAYDLQLPPWLTKDNGMVKVDAGYIKLAMTHTRTHTVCLPPNDTLLFHVSGMDGFSLAKAVSTPVIPSNNDPELAEAFGRSNAMKEAERRLWEIYGGALYVRIADDSGMLLRNFFKKYTFDIT